MNLFLSKIKAFSRENWWIYLVLIICLFLVYLTGRGNIAEIFILFIANFIGNVFIMIMQDYYTKKENKLGSFYHLAGISTFTLISIYGFIYAGEKQYLVFQIPYILSAVKTIVSYNTNISTKGLNEVVMSVLNVILLTVFFKYFYSSVYQVFQVIGFSLITIGLVSLKDKIRYWFNIIGIFSLTFGSGFGVYQNYLAGNIEGINVGFFLLTGTVLVFYLKLLPKYLKNA